jgi:hypothetical protein
MSIINQLNNVFDKEYIAKNRVKKFVCWLIRFLLFFIFCLFLLAASHFFDKTANFIRECFIGSSVLFGVCALLIVINEYVFVKKNILNEGNPQFLLTDEMLEVIALSDDVEYRYKRMIADELLKTGHVSVGHLLNADKENIVLALIESESKKTGYKKIIKYSISERNKKPLTNTVGTKTKTELKKTSVLSTSANVPASKTRAMLKNGGK